MSPLIQRLKVCSVDLGIRLTSMICGRNSAINSDAIQVALMRVALGIENSIAILMPSRLDDRSAMAVTSSSGRRLATRDGCANGEFERRSCCIFGISCVSIGSRFRLIPTVFVLGEDAACTFAFGAMVVDCVAEEIGVTVVVSGTVVVVAPTLVVAR